MFEKLDEIQDTLYELNQEEQLDYLLEFSQELDNENYPKSKLTQKYLVNGCVSEVYLFVEIKNDKIKVYAKTDSLFVKSYLAILLSAVNNLTIQQFKKYAKKRIDDFLVKTNIQKSLSPTRANTFGNIFERIEKMC